MLIVPLELPFRSISPRTNGPAPVQDFTQTEPEPFGLRSRLTFVELPTLSDGSIVIVAGLAAAALVIFTPLTADAVADIWIKGLPLLSNTPVPMWGLVAINEPSLNVVLVPSLVAPVIA